MKNKKLVSDIRKRKGKNIAGDGLLRSMLMDEKDCISIEKAIMDAKERWQ